MFYKMIENKCKEWYSSDQCTVRNLIEYIEKTGQGLSFPQNRL